MITASSSACRACTSCARRRARETADEAIHKACPKSNRAAAAYASGAAAHELDHLGSRQYPPERRRRCHADVRRSLTAAALRTSRALAASNLHAGRINSTPCRSAACAVFIASTAITLRWLYLTYRNLFGLQVTGLTLHADRCDQDLLSPDHWLYICPIALSRRFGRVKRSRIAERAPEWKAYSWRLADPHLRCCSWTISRISISINPFPDNPPW